MVTFLRSFSVGQEGKLKLKRKTKQECPQLGKAVNCILNCAFLDCQKTDSINKSSASHTTQRNYLPWLIMGAIITNLSSHFDIRTIKTALKFNLN